MKTHAGDDQVIVPRVRFGCCRRRDLRGRFLLLGERVLHPRDRDHEQRPKKQSEQDVDPGDRHVVGGHAQRCPDGAERSVMFHDDVSDEVRAGAGKALAGSGG